MRCAAAVAGTVIAAHVDRLDADALRLGTDDNGHARARQTVISAEAMAAVPGLIVGALIVAVMTLTPHRRKAKTTPETATGSH